MKIEISIESGGFALRLQNPNASERMVKLLTRAQLIDLIEMLEKARDLKVDSIHVGTV